MKSAYVGVLSIIEWCFEFGSVQNMQYSSVYSVHSLVIFAVNSGLLLFKSPVCYDILFGA